MAHFELHKRVAKILTDDGSDSFSKFNRLNGSEKLRLHGTHGDGRLRKEHDTSSTDPV